MAATHVNIQPQVPKFQQNATYKLNHQQNISNFNINSGNMSSDGNLC